jgi:hypothetical protein
VVKNVNVVVISYFAFALSMYALHHSIRERKLNGAANKLKTVLSIIFASVAFAIMVAAQVWTLPALIP